MKQVHKLATWCGLLGACAALAALPANSAPAAQRVVVPMANMKYGRMPAGLKAGDTIVWVNRDSVPHTVTARDKSFDLRLSPGQSRSMVLKAGTTAFYCIYHPAMRGTLSVGAP